MTYVARFLNGSPPNLQLTLALFAPVFAGDLTDMLQCSIQNGSPGRMKMQMVLIGGPGHLLSVEAEPGAQVYDLPQPDQVHRYRRKLWLDEGGTSVRAFFVHADLSSGESEALMMMHVAP